MKRQQMRELAAEALHAAMREDWPAVKQAFAGISADGHAITFSLMGWCDTAIGLQAEMQGRSLPDLGEPVAEMVRPGWMDLNTGLVTLDADAMPPAARWAGQMIAARAAMDEAQFMALIAAMPGDGFKRGEYAVALLRGCAGIANLSQQAAGGQS